jgi:hypothetical protein
MLAGSGGDLMKTARRISVVCGESRTRGAKKRGQRHKGEREERRAEQQSGDEKSSAKTGDTGALKKTPAINGPPPPPPFAGLATYAGTLPSAPVDQPTKMNLGSDQPYPARSKVQVGHSAASERNSHA